MVKNSQKGFKKYQKLSKTVNGGQNRSVQSITAKNIFLSCPKRSTTIKSGQQRSKMVNNGPKWSIRYKHGQKRPKTFF